VSYEAPQSTPGTWNSTCLGYGRGEHFASPDGTAFDQRRAYELPERLRFNHWALAGETLEITFLEPGAEAYVFIFG
jgi:hypothetical protein